MRQLTSKQKKILIDYIKENPDIQNGFKGADNLPSEIYDKLVEINDTEILYQEVNNFLHEYSK